MNDPKNKPVFQRQRDLEDPTVGQDPWNAMETPKPAEIQLLRDLLTAIYAPVAEKMGMVYPGPDAKDLAHYAAVLLPLIRALPSAPPKAATIPQFPVNIRTTGSGREREVSHLEYFVFIQSQLTIQSELINTLKEADRRLQTLKAFDMATVNQQPHGTSSLESFHESITDLIRKAEDLESSSVADPKLSETFSKPCTVNMSDVLREGHIIIPPRR